MHTKMFTRLALTFAVVAIFLTDANESQAQLSVDLKAKVGVTSATITNTHTGDPIFDVGGGANAAVMLRFQGGIAAGLNFNYQYDGHRNLVSTGDPSSTMSFNCPSFGIKARFNLMPNVEGGAWANYVFGSTWVKPSGSPEIDWANQGFELGAEAVLAYQLKPYKTYILAGAYAYFQYLQLFRDPPPPDPQVTDMTATNYGVGASLGVRFDFAL
ncbi:MAG: hypothetical protein CO108_16145 [Deltaproteobacteria bacterium CG_4_9_14_3_um_filter_63_12]|nr:MAG: hypothetical protein CO108_16145 [Deltaproteobacteria bacterium CG_4_9_14_3_um_filter_63_12]